QRLLVVDDHDLGHGINIPLRRAAGQRAMGNLHCPFPCRPPPRPPGVRPTRTMTTTNRGFERADDLRTTPRGARGQAAPDGPAGPEPARPDPGGAGLLRHDPG